MGIVWAAHFRLAVPVIGGVWETLIPYTRHSAVVASSLLCPEMILGLADPTTPAAIALLLAWVFGTNFVLYGIAGLLLGGARAWFRRAYVHRGS